MKRKSPILVVSIFACLSMLSGYTEAVVCDGITCTGETECIEVLTDSYCPVAVCSDNSVCNSQGECTPVGVSPTHCVCDGGFVGEICGFNDGTCEDNGCFGGTCVVGTDGGFTCDCDSKYTGALCDHLVADCDGNCGGAACDETQYKGNTVYKCDCPGGKDGPHCEIDVNCNGVVCQNGGTCLPGSSGYTCDCQSAYGGTDCEYLLVPGACSASACNDKESVCTTVDVSFHYCSDCSEVVGYDGPDCDIDVNECSQDSNICQNGGTCTNTVGSYSCECANGFDGANCDFNQGACEADVSCSEGTGACVQTGDMHKCNCAGTNFAGLQCETGVDFCIDNVCNGGTCTSVDGAAVCDCTAADPKLAGSNCQYAVEDGDCLVERCSDHGQCTAIQSTHYCICNAGYEGASCATNSGDCSSNVCGEGGTCTDGVQDFSCICPDGKFGPTCDIPVVDGVCTDNFCNFGICEDLGSVHFCVCNNGFTGDTCLTVVDLCADVTCENGGTCVADSTAGTASCRCSTMYFGDKCQNVAICMTSADCNDNGDCVMNGDLDGTSCVCRAGASGDTCDVLAATECGDATCETLGPCVIDECPVVCGDQSCTDTGDCITVDGVDHCPVASCDPAMCNNNGDCVEDPDDATRHYCACRAGASGIKCSTLSAISCGGVACSDAGPCVTDADDDVHCPVKPCTDESDCSGHGDCTEDSGSSGVRYCDCGVGFSGEKCERIDGKCKDDSCFFAGECNVESDGGFTCDCDELFTGDRCEYLVSPCTVASCNDGTCAQSPYNGYTVFRCENCPIGKDGPTCNVDIDYCSEVVCQNGGTCSYENTFYTCECQDGYTGSLCQYVIVSGACDPGCNGGNCELVTDSITTHYCVDCTGVNGKGGADCEVDLNECADDPCKNGATCVNTDGSYECTCADGFDGDNCDYNVGACVSGTSCSGLEDAACTTSTDMHQCDCAGTNKIGMSCEETFDYCADDYCNGGACVDETGAAVCDCAGTSPLMGGDRCEYKLLDGDCTTEDCSFNGECTIDDTKHYCVCTVGYTGDQCAENIDDCVEGVCGTGNCVDGLNDFSCDCLSGTYGLTCEVTLTTGSCQDDSCNSNGQCASLSASFYCICNPGYDGDTCDQAIGYCAELSCLNGGTCVESRSAETATCFCKTGYLGDACENVEGTCADDTGTCQNAGVCTDLEIGFKCTCSSDFIGSFCENNNKCAALPCLNEGVCSTSGTDFVCNCADGYTGSTCADIGNGANVLSAMTGAVFFLVTCIYTIVM